MPNVDNSKIELSSAALASISQHIATPTYDRARLKPQIVHLGVGHFARAHLAKWPTPK